MPPVPPDEPTAGEQRVVPTAPSDVVLGRYLDGGCSAVERRVVEAWAAADPSHGAMLEALRLAWFDGLTGRDARIATWRATWDADRAWQQLLAVRDGSQREGAERTPRRTVDPRAAASEGSGFPRPWPQGVGGGSARRVAAIAVSLVVVLGVGVAVGAGRHRARFGAAAGREYTTAAGQRLSVTLVDGTQLILAPATRVRVAANYGRGAGAREVELKGEAYFAVVHDAAHPFIVRARGAVAQDIGTAFDVRAYPEDGGARIAVADGAVAVSAAGGCRAGLEVHSGCGAQVQAGDVATISDGGVSVNHSASIAALTAWTTGELQFRTVPVRVVATDVGRWYGLEIIVPDSVLADRRVTLTVRDNALEQTLGVVAAVAHARYKWHGHHVVFFANPGDQ